MITGSLCCECDGTGWILYCSETVDGAREEAYRLCPNCYAPRRCMGSKADHPCSRPGTVRYGPGYYCNEHIEVIHDGRGDVDQAPEAIYYLRCWLQTARGKANDFLEVQLLEALDRAETQLNCAERELDKASEDVGEPP